MPQTLTHRTTTGYESIQPLSESERRRRLKRAAAADHDPDERCYVVHRFGDSGPTVSVWAKSATEARERACSS